LFVGCGGRVVVDADAVTTLRDPLVLERHFPLDRRRALALSTAPHKFVALQFLDQAAWASASAGTIFASTLSNEERFQAKG
jgi:hypothetical protein